MTFFTFWASSQLLRSAKCVMKMMTHVVLGSACQWQTGHSLEDTFAGHGEHVPALAMLERGRMALHYCL